MEILKELDRDVMLFRPLFRRATQHRPGRLHVLHLHFSLFEQKSARFTRRPPRRTSAVPSQRGITLLGLADANLPIDLPRRILRGYDLHDENYTVASN